MAHATGRICGALRAGITNKLRESPENSGVYQLARDDEVWKIDCNFRPNARSEFFEGEDWSERKDGQPFFARITFGGTHRSWHRDPQRPVDPKDVEIPP